MKELELTAATTAGAIGRSFQKIFHSSESMNWFDRTIRSARTLYAEFKNTYDLYQHIQHAKVLDMLSRQYHRITEKQRDLAVNQAAAAAWEDGSISDRERFAIAQLEIALQQQRVSEAAQQLQYAYNVRSQLDAQNAYFQAKIQLGKLIGKFNAEQFDSRERILPRTNDAAFSAQVLNILGGNAVTDRIAKATEESARLLAELNRAGNSSTFILE